MVLENDISITFSIKIIVKAVIYKKKSYFLNNVNQYIEECYNKTNFISAPIVNNEKIITMKSNFLFAQSFNEC